MTQSSAIISRGHGKAGIAKALAAGLVVIVLAHDAAWGATLGMIANEGSDTVTVFDADSHAVVVSLPIGPSSVIGDCVVNSAGTRGLVTDFTANLWVVDLTTMPPTLAGGTNPIPISNLAAEDVALTADGAYAVVCDGDGPDPVSVVSVASQTEVDTLGLGHDCNSVDVCDDGSVLVTSAGFGTVRRLTIDGSGSLSDTGEQLSLGGTPNNVVCASGGQSGFALIRGPGEVKSFLIPGLTLQDTRTMTGNFGISGAVDGGGGRAYVRSNLNGAVDAYAFNGATGVLGALPLFSIPVSNTPTFYGMDQLAFYPSADKLFVSQAAAVNVYDATTGGSLGSITDVNISGATGVCLPVSVAQCGNGDVEAGEQCDDGNIVNGDCCTSTCQYEASGSPCPGDGDACTDGDVCDGAGTCSGSTPTDCDDGNPCTQDSCDSGSGCANDTAPTTGCKPAGKSLLLLKNNTDDAKDKLVWKWLKGPATGLDDLGVPTTTTSYTLCLYAGTSSASVALPAGSSWQPAGTKGFKYKNAAGTPEGAQKGLLKSGTAGKAKALVKGKGMNLPDGLAPTLALPVTAQLVNDSNNVCFEAVYLTAVKNDAQQFKAKTP